MTAKNTVAVLLAAYNGSDFLEEQLATIASQSVKADVYISLDLSSDSSFHLIDNFCKNYTNFFFLPYGKRYGSAGKNFFRLISDVDLTHYSYVCFSDQDDIWELNKLEIAIEQIIKNNVDAYSSNVTAFWETGRCVILKKDFKQTLYDFLFESAGPGCTYVLSNSLVSEIKNSLIEKSDLLDKIWLHDWYCYSFARSKNYRWFIDSFSSMRYRQHSSNEVGANSGLKSFLHRVRSIISGDGLKKTLDQALFLNLSELKPTRYLLRGDRISLFKLAFLANQCRRKPIDKFLFFLIFLYFSIVGLPKNVK